MTTTEQTDTTTPLAMAAWERGDIGDAEAVRYLHADLEEIEEALKRAEAAKKHLRTHIERVVARHPAGLTIAGIGKVAMTPGGLTTRYNVAVVDEGIGALLDLAQRYHLCDDEVTYQRITDIAQAIASGRLQSERAAYLRIDREKATRS